MTMLGQSGYQPAYKAVREARNAQATSLTSRIRSEREGDSEVFLRGALWAVPGSLIGAVDTIGQSVGLLEDDSVQSALNAVQQAVGTAGLAQAYKENSSGYRIAGDIATTVVGYGAITKVLRAPAILKNGASTLGLVARSNSKSNMLSRIILADQAPVRRSLQMYAREAAIFGRKTKSSEFAQLDRARKLSTDIRKKVAVNSLRENVAAELAIFGLQNESELYFPEGISAKDLIFSAGLGITLPTAVAQFALNPMLKRASGIAGKAAAKENRVFTGDAGFDLVSGLHEELDIAIRRQTADIQVQINKDPDIGDQLNQISSTAKKKQNEAIEKLRTATPYQFSIKMEQDSGISNTIKSFAKDNPRTATALTSVEPASLADNFERQRIDFIFQLNVQKGLAQIDARNAKTGSSEQVRAEAKVREIQQQIVDIQQNTFYLRVNRAGNASSNLKDRSILDDAKVKSRIISTSPDVRKQDQVAMVIGDDDIAAGMSLSGRLYRQSGKNTSGARTMKVVASGTQLDHYEQSKFAMAIGNAVDGLVSHIEELAKGARVSGTIQPNVLTDAATVEELEFVYAASVRLGFDNPNFRKHVDLSQFSDQEDLMLALVQAKYDRYLQLVDAASNLNVRNIEADYDIAARLMIPSATDFDTYSPAIMWFDNLRAANVESVGDNLNEALADFSNTVALDLTPKTTQELFEIQGSLFERTMFFDMPKRLGKEERTAVTLVGKKPVAMTDDNWHIDWSDQAVVANIFRKERMDTLANTARTNPYVSHLGRFMARLSEIGQVRDEIKQAVPTITAAQGRKPLLKEAGEILPTQVSFDQRHVPGSSAADMAWNAVSREADSLARQDIRENSKALQTLLKSENQGSKLRYLDYESTVRTRNWVLVPDAVEDAMGNNGMIKLAQDNEVNKEIAKQMGLDDVPEFVPSAYDETHTAPLQLDELSHRALMEDIRYSDIDYFTNQALMKANEMGDVTYRIGHTMVPTSYDKEVVFLADETGRVIDFAVADNISSAKAEMLRRAKGRKSDENSFTTIITRDSLEEWHAANNRAWNDKFLDMSDIWNQTKGAEAKGTRQGIILDNSYIEGKLQAIHDMYISHARRLMATEFRAELTQLDVLSRNAALDQAGVIRDPATGKAASSYSNAYQKFVSQLLGRPVNNPGAVVAILNRGVEGLMDSALDNVWRKLFDFNSDSRVLSRAAKFEKGFEELGFDPVTTALNAVQREIGGKSPLMSRKLSQEMAKGITFLSLRMFEPGHALLTTSSILTTAPHTVSWFKRGARESHNAYLNRVGPVGKVVGDHVVPNPFKLTWHTLTKFFRGDYKAILQEAEKRGYLVAHQAEFMNEVTGKVASADQNKILAGLRKGITAPTDWSENFARKFTFLIGYEMFNRVGTQGQKISLAAANDFANKAIADYSPHQRSQVFRGAAGIQLGLFQTFAINYIQRLALAIENKQARALFTQLATQQFMFGAKALPGWEQFNESVFATWDQSARPEDQFAAMESEGLSDLFLYGTVANLPKLLGMDANTAYSRGSIQVPKTRSVIDWRETPGAVISGRFYNAMSDGIKAAVQTGGEVGGQRFLESLALAMPNRPLKGIMERHILGYASNKYGDIVSGPDEEFKSFENTIARYAGLRPLREAKRAEVLWRNTQRKIIQRNRMATLRESLAAKLRTNKPLSRDALAGVFEDYIAYGGSPEQALNWIKRVALKASIPRYERELSKAMKSSSRMNDVVRMLLAVEGGRYANETFAN